MKKKYRILVLVATLFLGVLLTQSFNRANADDYPDIGTKYDLSNMKQYSDDQLFDSVTFKNFCVKSISFDRHHNERIVFTNVPESKTYFFTVLRGGHKKHLAVGDSVTLKGDLNGRVTLEKTQANSWFNKSLFGKDAILVLTDSYK